MTPPAVEVIINSASGGLLADDTRRSLEPVFAHFGIDASFRNAVKGHELTAHARAAVGSDAEVIAAGGGDGTISAVAEEIYKAKKTLGVLPLGTLNNFSKDLGISQGLEEAVRVLKDGTVIEIDLGEVNGRTFINNSSIGLYPRMVRKREQQQSLGYGKWRSALWAAIRIFQLSPFLKVRIDVDGKSFVRKTPFVFVGNNEYEMELYNIGRRVSLVEGKLSVYFLRRGGRWGVILLLLRTLTGTVRQWRDFEEILTDQIVIQTRRKRLQVAIDGEVRVMETPLEYKILPGALKVIVPLPAENENA